MGCPAQLIIKRLFIYPTFKVDPNASKSHKTANSNKLKSLKGQIPCEISYSCLIPDISKHQNHTMGEAAGFTMTADPRSSSTHMSDEPADDPPSTFTSSCQPLELARETLKRITSLTYLTIPPEDQHLLHQDLLAMEHRLLVLLPKKEGIALAAPKQSIRRLPRTAALPKKKRMCTRSFVMKPPEPSDPALDDQTCIVVSANVSEIKQSIKSNINI
ncbi:uncharacterized protein [Watersipora subatra]|uniref:uncharacterized protein n=1 Tax=Watersipora subatra TaxID=2589382 RepID=UPI00355B7317